jgi:TM2 domain-containing membrane protein YozV
MKKRVGVLCVVISLLALAFGATAQPNEAWIPGVASLVLPGLGQFLNDEVGKAFLHLGIAVALDVGAYYVATLLPFSFYTYPVVGLVHLAWGLYSAYDAYSVAKDQGFTIGVVENGFALSYSF